jgi:hypothetical protein
MYSGKLWYRLQRIQFELTVSHRPDLLSIVRRKLALLP